MDKFSDNNDYNGDIERDNDYDSLKSCVKVS
jgi:hypothetical protein